MPYIKNAKLEGNAWVGHGAVVVGNVTLKDESGVWYNAVVRGDMCSIEIGRGTNIQDCAVVHTNANHPVKIGAGTSVGHSAVIHGCTIGDNCLIGMGAIVLNGAKIGNDCIVGAGSLVTQNKEFPDGVLILGSPAKVVRPLTEEEIKQNQTNAITYMLMKNVQ